MMIKQIDELLEAAKAILVEIDAQTDAYYEGDPTVGKGLAPGLVKRLNPP